MTLLLIFLSLYIGINIRFSIISVIIELIILLVFAFFRINKKFPLILAFVSLTGVGLSFIRPSFTKARYEGMVVEVKENYYIFSSTLEKFYISEYAHNREVGDYLSIEGYKEELDFITLESDFDFGDYLNRKGVYSELIVKNLKVKFSNPIKVHQFKRDFLEKFDDNSRGVVSSILFAYSGESETTDLSRDLHLMRLVSSSGVYLFFLYKLINKLLSLIIKKEKINEILSLVALSPYLVFTFPKFIIIKFFSFRYFI